MAAQPLLLADSVRRLLAVEDVDVTLVLEPDAQRIFDVAVATRQAPAVRAEFVVVLDDGTGNDDTTRADPDEVHDTVATPACGSEVLLDSSLEPELGPVAQRQHPSTGIVVASLSELVAVVRRVATELATTPPAE